jgi:hypothetical protein
LLEHDERYAFDHLPWCFISDNLIEEFYHNGSPMGEYHAFAAGLIVRIAVIRLSQQRKTLLFRQLPLRCIR